MKTKVSVFLLLLSSAITLTSATYKGDASQVKSAQSPIEDVFRSFNLHRQGADGISLSWTVSSNHVSDFIIQRSYDGEYFDDLDLHIKTLGRWNRANDTEVFPGIIWYRIVAVMDDGTEAVSPTQYVRIVRRK